MKTFKVKIEYIGIAGKYVSEITVKARNYTSAGKKAERTIGYREGWVFSIIEVTK